MSDRVASRAVEAPVERLQVSAFRIPTDYPEADGTLEWHASSSGARCIGSRKRRGSRSSSRHPRRGAVRCRHAPAVRGATPDTLLVADGFSCREQIAQQTGRRSLHLAEVLALAMRDSSSPAL
jgi:hypothetical protein